MIATKYIHDAGLAEYFADKRARNAEAMRRLFKAEAGRAETVRTKNACLALADETDDMLDRVFRSVKV